MKRLPPRDTAPDTRFPYTTLFRSRDFVGIGIEDRRMAVGGDRQFVDIDGDRALEAGTIAVGVDAARREIVEILRRPVDDDTRRVLRDAPIADDAEVIELFLPASGDVERYILKARGTARRGQVDVMVVGRKSGGEGKGVLVGGDHGGVRISKKK